MTKHFFARGAAPIADSEVMASIKRLNIPSFFSDDSPYRMDLTVQNEFLDYFPLWINSSKLNTILGLSNFKNRYLIAGITQAFDDFYIRHAKKNIVLLPGEYPYLKRFIKNWRFYDGVFKNNDALILSAPFSATGALHKDFASIMEQADKHDIPTLIDCAFFGICADLNLNLNYNCIESVCFSFSKAFASGCFRAGIQFTHNELSSISIQNRWHYLPLLSAKITLELAKQYSPDFIYQKYQDTQSRICERFNLTPSKTVIFGLSNDESYDDFDLDNTVNRCCITQQVTSDISTQTALT